MKTLSAIADPVYHPKISFSHYERFWLKYINDKRDLPFIHLLTSIHILVIPVAIFLYTPVLDGWQWWLVYIPYCYVSQFYYKGRFGLMLHNICHRKLFKKPYRWINNWVIWGVCPFFGHTPETYFVHHMAMHHVENNMPDDTSSTLAYKRDSFGNFLLYYLKFIFLGFRDTFMYLFNRRRKKMYMRMTFGEFSFFAFCIIMCFVNLKATLWIFIIPFIVARFVMMIGNWAQHAFIDKNDPENHFTSSINCINTSYNRTCWNDGYHVIHHLRPAMHYTEMPVEFMKQKDKLAEEKSLVFDGIHFLHIFIYLVTKRYDKLADNLVNINNMFSSKEEAIAIMKERTKKIKLPADFSNHKPALQVQYN